MYTYMKCAYEQMFYILVLHLQGYAVLPLLLGNYSVLC